MCIHVYISFMRATCPANIILLYYNTLKYLARGLNYEAACYYDVFIFVTFFFLRFPALKYPPVCVLHVQSQTEYAEQKASFWSATL
jgi:hypothetical protein